MQLSRTISVWWILEKRLIHYKERSSTRNSTVRWIMADPTLLKEQRLPNDGSDWGIDGLHNRNYARSFAFGRWGLLNRNYASVESIHRGWWIEWTARPNQFDWPINSWNELSARISLIIESMKGNEMTCPREWINVDWAMDWFEPRAWIKGSTKDRLRWIGGWIDSWNQRITKGSNELKHSSWMDHLLVVQMKGFMHKDRIARVGLSG